MIPARWPFTKIDRLKPVAYIVNSDDCRPYGAANSAQSDLDAQAHAAAWGFSDARYIAFSWPNVRQMRVSDYTTATRLACTTAPYVGLTFFDAVNQFLNSLSELQAVFVSTYIPGAFAVVDVDNPPTDNFVCVSGAALVAWQGYTNVAVLQIRNGTKYTGGYAAFGTTVPANILQTARNANVVPHGRLGCFDITSTTIRETALDPGIGLPGETLTAFCTRTAKNAMRRVNYSRPHIVIPNARFWSSPSLPLIPDAANTLLANWLRDNGCNAFVPGDSYPDFANDSTRFLLAPLANSRGAWTLGPTPGIYGPTSFVSTGASSYTVPGGFLTAGVPAQVLVDGVYLPQLIPNQPTTNPRWAADGATLVFTAGNEPPAGAIITLAQAATALPSSFAVNAFAFYVGTGSPNGLPSNVVYQYDGNILCDEGFHGCVWQSGNGYAAYSLFRRGACAMIGSIGGPLADSFPETQELLRNLIMTGASMAEINVATQAGPQVLGPTLYWPVRTEAMGEPMYSPYYRENSGALFSGGPLLLNGAAVVK